ncbi:hypothetical protein BGX38DRAFT_361704 [Terfezia claveryi]|nr:hypothetical protein BGX38DRAFT_361704 [Terfezia claveryi]
MDISSRSRINDWFPSSWLSMTSSAATRLIIQQMDAFGLVTGLELQLLLYGLAPQGGDHRRCSSLNNRSNHHTTLLLPMLTTYHRQVCVLAMTNPSASIFTKCAATSIQPMGILRRSGRGLEDQTSTRDRYKLRRGPTVLLWKKGKESNNSSTNSFQPG